VSRIFEISFSLTCAVGGEFRPTAGAKSEETPGFW
jgi:hypothetical protein